MIRTLLLGLLQFVFNTISNLLQPINDLIDSNFPDFSQAITQITSFLNLCLSAFGWAVSTIGIPDYILGLVITTIVVRLTLLPLVHLVKFILKWYKAIVP